MGLDKPRKLKTITFSNGGIYYGSWLNMMKHGFGEYQREDGQLYVGQFIENKYEG